LDAVEFLSYVMVNDMPDAGSFLKAVGDLVASAASGANGEHSFDRTTLTLNATLLPAVSDPGRFHFNVNTSYYVKLWGKLDWNFTLYGNWDNRPPPGFSSSDYGTTSGLSLTFGNR
jgi:hypothetical protein